MELTYQIMLYGGIVGAIVTLSIAIWLFIKLDIADVIQDLTGIRVKKQKRNQTTLTSKCGITKGAPPAVFD